ncbi:MAG: DUF1287 domain-containing protein [Verrucomicrobiales bacterium]|nr:DUF1287 domain-containing protein [Verrucomicrobiales bacterium]
MLSAQGTTSVETKSASFADRLVEAANFRTFQEVRYDPAYVVLDYPGGDVPSDMGVCTDVVIRSYRTLGIDLQKLVHEDMKQNFSVYPENWGLKRPDKNIDHRRVPNLERFLEREGAEIEANESPIYLPGDLVAWDLTGNGLWHIGIVVGPDTFVHNIGSGPETETGINQWKVVGHYRYFPEAE